MTRFRQLSWAVLPVLLAAGAFALPTTVLRDLGPPFPPPVPPTVLAADRAEVTGRQPVEVALKWLPGRTVRAPSWSGLITAVHVESGDRVSTGDPVVAVDRITRIGAATAAPFHRTLTVGDRGTDVVDLHDLLQQLGLMSETPGRVDLVSAETARAISALARQLGAEGAAAFDPAWVIWLPEAPFAVQSVVVNVGDSAMAGADVATSQATLASAAVISPDPDRPLDLVPGTAYVIRVGSDRPFDVAVEDATVAETDLATFASDLLAAGVTADSDERALGVIELADSAAGWAVVPSAVVETPDRDCVFVPSGNDSTRPLPVTVLGSEPGRTVVETAHPVRALSYVADPSSAAARRC